MQHWAEIGQEFVAERIKAASELVYQISRTQIFEYLSIAISFTSANLKKLNIWKKNFKDSLGV